MSKINNEGTYVYYLRKPIYATRERFFGAIMGSVWMKAVSRDALKKRYGLSDLDEICDVDCDEYILGTEDELKKDEE
jgi:hypothetical protein